MKKYIIGWMTIKPGMRDEFLAIAKSHAEATRREPGCLFMEINFSREDEHMAVVAECFADAAAHDWHNQTDYMAHFRERMSHILSFGRFLNIFSDEVTEDVVRFD